MNSDAEVTFYLAVVQEELNYFMIFLLFWFNEHSFYVIFTSSIFSFTLFLNTTFISSSCRTAFLNLREVERRVCFCMCVYNPSTGNTGPGNGSWAALNPVTAEPNTGSGSHVLLKLKQVVLNHVPAGSGYVSTSRAAVFPWTMCLASGRAAS